MSTALLPSALPVAAPARSAGPASAVGLYRIAPDHTAIEISVRSFGVPVRGRLTAVTGCIDVRDDVTASRVSVTACPASFTSGHPVRDRHVRARILDVETHPVLSFEADRTELVTEAVTAADGTRPLWQLVGSLKILGTRRPLRLHVGPLHFTDRRRSLEFSASATVRRDHLGVTAPHLLVGGRLTVRVTGRAERLC
jgi:polyisoprenoid-binding protein YceI